MYLWDGDCGVYDLNEGVPEKVGVGSVHDAFVVTVELYVGELLVVGAGYGNGGG